VNLTTLPNGLRVASLPSHSAISSVGVFVDVGSRYETPDSNGISHFLELMSLKSTINRTDFRLVREMQKMGANVSALTSREHMIYTADSLKEYVPAMIGTFGDVIQNHQFHIEELMEEKEIYEKEFSEKMRNTDLQIMDGIHEAAYGNTGLGLPLHAPLQNLHFVTPENLKLFQRLHFTPKRMVVSGVGVDHQQFVDLVAAVFSNLQPDSSPELAKELGINKIRSVYQGGEVRQHRKGEFPLTHIALAFETSSWHDKDLVPMCVLQLLMGGGGAFSAGGPGKGMYSRLYNNILNKHDWVESATCFNSIFSDTALFGLYGNSLPNKSKDLVEELAKEALKMSGPVETAELNRAKTQLKSTVFFQLESRTAKLEDLGRQIMTYGKVQSAEEVCKLIDAVKAEDVQRVARKLISTPISVSALGDCSYLPRYDQIQRYFK